MKEVKTPKKPLIYYYGIVLLVLIVFNLVVSPILMEHQVEETDYGTFMSMINDKNIGKVEVEDNQIVFTDKNNEKIYKTMSSTGACSLTVGIIVLATGIVTGIMMIVNGARLLKKKSEILI